MNEVKPWYTSKTIWGGIVAMVASVAGILGYGVPVAEQAALVDSLALVGGAAGGLLAIFGRIVSKGKIG